MVNVGGIPRVVARKQQLGAKTTDLRNVEQDIFHDLDYCKNMVVQVAKGFPNWSTMSAEFRASHLLKTADLIEKSKDEFISSICTEIYAPREWAEHNVSFSAKILRAVASYATELGHIDLIENEGEVLSIAKRVPCGVCLAITPWNAPLILSVRAIAAPLLCGNTVLLKGNELAPRTAVILSEILEEAGIPNDVVRIVLTRTEDSDKIVEELISSPVVRRISFTGSTRVGKRVAEHCAKHLKRPLLELSGQASMIVLEDSDLNAVTEAATFGAFYYQGQICMSTERLIVSEPIASKLVKKLEEKRKKFRVYTNSGDDFEIGPLINITESERISSLISDAISKGARLIGGGIIRSDIVEPTIIDRVDSNMRLYHEEVFGPVLSIIRVENDTEAITVANDSEFGLVSSVFSNDLNRATKIADQIHSGICHINRTTVDDNPHAPFGGVKSSGFGRFGGKWALEEFTELKWITSKTGGPLPNNNIQ